MLRKKLFYYLSQFKKGNEADLYNLVIEEKTAITTRFLNHKRPKLSAIMKNKAIILKLQQVLEKQANLELAVLVGSQAENRAHSGSDWDVAIQWKRELSTFENLGSSETLRRELARVLKLEESMVDLINLPSAGLAMRALVAENGIPLKGEDSLEWNHFLSRTWRELEMYEWEKQHAS